MAKQDSREYVPHKVGYLRITDGPVKVWQESLWPPGAKFVYLRDLSTGEVTYGSRVEIAVKLNIKSTKLRSIMQRHKQVEGYYISYIPKDIFIKRTGRKFQLSWDYAYKY